MIQGAAAKRGPFRAILDPWASVEQVCYMGDDLADLPVLAAAGLAACPADAAAEVREAAHLASPAAGGRGAVREVVERILKETGEYDGLVATVAAVGATG